MEKDWNSLGIDEPYSAVAVARLFLNNAELSKSEIGEFLAGGKPFMKDVREAFSDLFDFTGMTFVASLREYLGGFKVRLQIIGNARIENVGKSQSCMVSKLPIIWIQDAGRVDAD